MESTNNPEDSKKRTAQAKTIEVIGRTVHAALDGNYSDGDYISPEAISAALKKYPFPKVVLNSDQKEVIGNVTAVDRVGKEHPMVTMHLHSESALQWIVEMDRQKKPVVFGIDCRILEKKGNVITKADFISVSLIPDEPYKPANPDAPSLGKFTLEEVAQGSRKEGPPTLSAVLEKELPFIGAISKRPDVSSSVARIIKALERDESRTAALEDLANHVRMVRAIRTGPNDGDEVLDRMFPAMNLMDESLARLDALPPATKGEGKS